MARTIFTPSTTPVSPLPSPLLLFIQQAQMELCTRPTQLDRLKATGQPRAAATSPALLPQ
jgi:hypothetical protein